MNSWFLASRPRRNIKMKQGMLTALAVLVFSLTFVLCMIMSVIILDGKVTDPLSASIVNITVLIVGGLLTSRISTVRRNPEGKLSLFLY